jgi:soluble lytic murein transglycosylase
MSSMWRVAVFLPVLLATAPSSSAQYAAPVAQRQPSYAPAPAFAANVGTSLNDWRRLRESSGYSFQDYARFLIVNPDWPSESTMRRWAERAMRPGEHAPTVMAFFAQDKPRTGTGYARLADAYAASGRAAEATSAAREAWASPDLSAADEQSLWARYGRIFSTTDHDRRVDALLFDKKEKDAARFVAMTSPSRRAAFAARVAMQSDADNADALYRAVIGTVTSDAGLMLDRARYLRANDYEQAARQLAARSHNFVHRPADPERFYDMLLLLANGAAADRQWQTAYNIARQIDDALPPGTVMDRQSLGVRDNYTSLAWLAGTAALDRLHNAPAAIAMFDRYARGGRSLQVETKGYYWAGRAALGARRIADANGYFPRAAAYPELFYGQLALERLGRSMTPPSPSVAAYSATSTQRLAFNSRRLVQALRILGQQGRPTEQALFVRALAESLDNDADRGLAVELGQQIARQDLPVWVARAARIKGSMFYARQAFPNVAAPVSADLWSIAHGIARQESSFDRYAISGAGARGMMQLMVPTARERAQKMGIDFSSSRLLSDPSYNMMLGSAYFRWLLDYWDGNVPLAVASYNGGMGNVRKWVNAYGDPRRNVDVLKWIEAIPFPETKGYVQRVIENSVVYDSIRPSNRQRSTMHVSRYLGKSRPG